MQCVEVVSRGECAQTYALVRARLIGFALAGTMGFVGVSSASAQLVQVTGFSRSTTGTSSATAGASTQGPLPLSSASTSWSALPFGTILVPTSANQADAVCGPNGATSQSGARVDQYIAINPNGWQVASTVYGIASVSVHPCSTLSASGGGSTSAHWSLNFQVLSTVSLSLHRADAAVNAGNSLGATAQLSWTISGPSGAVTGESITAPSPIGADVTQSTDSYTLMPGSYSLVVDGLAQSTSAGNASTALGGTSYAGFDLTFAFSAACDVIDFNSDGLFPDTADIDDFLSVFSGGPCSTGTCNDIDFNNDGLFPDTADIDALLTTFSGGVCTP